MTYLKPLTLAVVVPRRPSRFKKSASADAGGLYGESAFTACGSDTLTPRQMATLIIALHDDMAPHVAGGHPFSSVTLTGDDPVSDDGWPYAESVIHALRERRVKTEISLVTNARSLSARTRELVALKPVNVVVRFDGALGDPAAGLTQIGDSFMGGPGTLEHAANNIFAYLSYARDLASAPAGSVPKTDFTALQDYLQGSLSVHSVLYGENHPVARTLGTTNHDRLRHLARALAEYNFPVWHLSFELRKTPRGGLKRDRRNLPVDAMRDLLTLASDSGLRTCFNDVDGHLETLMSRLPHIYSIARAEADNAPLRLLPTGHVRTNLSRPLSESSPRLVPGRSPLETIGLKKLPEAGAETDTSLVQICSGYNTEAVLSGGAGRSPAGWPAPLFPLPSAT